MQTVAEAPTPEPPRADPVSIRLPRDLRQRAQRIATADKRSLSFVLVEMIRKGLESVEDE